VRQPTRADWRLKQPLADRVNNAIETPSERDHPVPVVNTVERLMAIDAHPETLDTDLAVAVAIANGETTVEGIDQELVDDSIEELIAALRRTARRGIKCRMRFALRRSQRYRLARSRSSSCASAPNSASAIE
jgi:hypothetical protein